MSEILINDGVFAVTAQSAEDAANALARAAELLTTHLRLLHNQADKDYTGRTLRNQVPVKLTLVLDLGMLTSLISAPNAVESDADDSPVLTAAVLQLIGDGSL